MGMYHEISRLTLVQLVIGVDPVMLRMRYEMTAVRINPCGMTRIRLNKNELPVCEN